MELNAKTAAIMLKLDELADFSENIGMEFVRTAYDLASNPNSVSAWIKACKEIRDRGDDYIALGSKTKRATDFIQPILEEMAAAGKERF